MAKDDYFVIAYRILDYLYKCLKAGVSPDIDFISPDALKINPGYFVNVMESLSDKGYIKGVCFPRSIGVPVGVKFSDLKITQDGIEFLQENSSIQKAKKAFQTFKSVMPGF